MFLGKLQVPGRPIYLDNSRARAYCTCSRCGCGMFGQYFLSFFFFVFSFSLSGRRTILTEILTNDVKNAYCLKGPLNPKQPTNQLFQYMTCLHLEL